MDEQNFSGRVALVTGGSGGIGAELSKQLASDGAVVAVHYSSNRQAAVFGADLRTSEAPEQLIDKVEASLGSIDILAANAGLSRLVPYEQVDAAMFDETIAVNLRAPYLLARRVLPGMCNRSFGRILFTSSIAAFTGGLVGPHYAASKAGIHGITHSLASWAASNGVTVNAIAPALIEDTNMLPGDPGELAKRIPVGRLGTPPEVANLAMAVLRNAYLTNQVISIDGGMYPR